MMNVEKLSKDLEKTFKETWLNPEFVESLRPQIVLCGQLAANMITVDPDTAVTKARKIMNNNDLLAPNKKDIEKLLKERISDWGNFPKKYQKQFINTASEIGSISLNMSVLSLAREVCQVFELVKNIKFIDKEYPDVCSKLTSEDTKAIEEIYLKVNKSKSFIEIITLLAKAASVEFEKNGNWLLNIGSLSVSQRVTYDKKNKRSLLYTQVGYGQVADWIKDTKDGKISYIGQIPDSRKSTI